MRRTNDNSVEEMVRKQLNLILNYGEIKNSLILSRFLEFVVEKKLNGNEDEIKEYTIGVKGLGKSSDFNPQLDASVRIHAGRLRRILQQYYAGPGTGDPVVIAIPKGSYIPVFEHHNGQSHVLQPVAEDARTPLPPEPQVRVNTDPKPALAVLPFHNLSSDQSKDYFVKGIGEQLSTDLARFQNISVISYFSTHNYDLALQDLQEMRQAIHVDYVLTGSVRFINETVRLNIQLIQSQNGQIIFTENYTRHLTPETIFDVQEEITGEILNLIADDNGIIVMNKAHASFGRAEHLSVQEAIYKYFEYASDFAPDKFEPAIYALEKAVAAEPGNALASALLSTLYMSSYATKKDPDNWLLQKAYELAQTSVRLDPQCQHAHKALAWGLLLYNKKEKSLEVIERCIKLNPKASGNISLMALAYICQGEYSLGFKWLLETVHLNPFVHFSSKLGLCLYYFNSGNYEESLKWIDRMAPVSTALFILIRLSLQGKINKNKARIDNSILELKDAAPEIIGRMVTDPGLRSEILHGLKLAGLTVK